MKITLDYGRTGLTVDLPDDRVVGPLAIRQTEPLADPAATLRDALANPIGTPPLAELARGRRSACILVCDITRPVPNALILPPVLRTLEEAGIPRDRITILVATGLHRPNEGAELDELVSPEIAANYRCVNHFGKELDQHTFLGLTPRGVPAWIDRRYVEADLKITTGLIEPHLMAGYSGGRKVICPGIAALETVRIWHGPKFLEHPRADCGSVAGNPVHEENTLIAKMAGCHFIVNVCLDGARQVTWLGAGDLVQAWEAGVRFVEGVVKVPVSEPLDVVVTSCAGYPLDTTWYQAVKGLSGALPVVKRGGTIVLAASLSEGVGGPEFRALLEEYGKAGRYASVAGGSTAGRSIHRDFCEMDEWQLVMYQKVLGHCYVKVVSGNFPADVLTGCRAEPAESVEQAVAECLAKYGPTAKVGVIPKGPYVLPYLAV